MKRDMDVVRELLLRIEAAPQRPSWKAIVTSTDDAVSDNELWHLKLMEDAGLVASKPIFFQGHRLPEMLEITWEGHDFLDSVRDPKIWEKTKKGAEAAGGFTLELMKDLAKGLLKKQVEEFTGVKL